MHISSLNFNPSFSRVSFKSNDCVALPANTIFLDDKKAFNFSERYKEIKKFNPAKASIIKLMRLNESDYESVIRAIYKSSKRVNALINKESQIAVSKSEDLYNGIIDDKLGLSFSNGHGFYNIIKSSNEKGNLYTKREMSYVNGCQSTEFTDKSRLNEDYHIDNFYKEIAENSHSGTITKIREIAVKDANSIPIFGYSYSKQDFPDLGYSVCNVNGKTYKTEINEDAGVTITSGEKTGRIDFSSRIADMPEEERQVFVKALKMLPPQIILSLDEYFDNIYSFENHFHTGLHCPAVSAKSVVDSTVEFLSKRHLLVNDKKLIETYECEKEKFADWLMYDSEGQLRKGASTYIKNYLSENPKDEIMEIIKSVCNMLWLEEYEETKTNDEDIRLLLSFFPETVGFIVSTFELNNIVNSSLKNAET